MDKLKLLVLFGGLSEEHPVSIRSAAEFSRHVDASRYALSYVYIGRDGSWRLVETPDGELAEGRPVTLSTNRAKKGLLCLDNFEVLPVDVVFPMLHGKFGEDGAVQGLFELAGVAYAGCGIAASNMCMDKQLTYLAAMRAGVETPNFQVLEGCEGCEIPFPVFVKPARSGSSFGVTKVSSGDAFDAAVREARKYDNKVLVEETISGDEIGCAVLGSGDALMVGALDQIVVSSGFFRIHQEENPEQGCENAEIRVPADIPEPAELRIKDAAKRVYRALGCEGLARVDMFLTPDGRAVLNEVNTMPGFTSYSRYPRMMRCAGYGMRELIDKTIDLAMIRGYNR